MVLKGFNFKDLKSEMSTDRTLVKDWDYIPYGKYRDNNRIYYKPMAKSDHDLDGKDGFLFYCLKFASCLANEEEWIGDSFEVDIVAAGYGFWDGIRHIYFHKDEEIQSDHPFDGYLYYPHIPDLIDMLSKLRELELKYCRDAEK